MKTIVTSRKKSILFISYYFPPNTAVGGLRIGNFAKNFHLLGWRTYALTIKDKYLTQMDVERLKGLEATKIYKTFIFPSVLKIFFRLVFFLESFFSKKVNIPDEPSGSFIHSDPNHLHTEKIFQKFKRYFFSLFIFLPDTEKRWILPAFFKAIWAIKRENIDCILTSSPPHSVHLTGLLISIFTRVRWVVDLRDPWFTCRSKMPHTTSLLSKKIEAWLEKKVFQRASLVLATNETFCNEIPESYKRQPQNKFLYIPNGYDADIFSNIEHLKKYDQFTISYTGTLYYGRSPEPVFCAIKKLIMEGRLKLEDIRIKLVGYCQYIDSYQTAEIIKSYGLDSVVALIDPIPYLRSLEIIKKSHLALLLAAGQPYQIPAKVYDYIGLGTQILALAKDGATSNLINSTKAGRVFSPTDIKGIKEFIYQSITNQKSLQTGIDSNIARKFDRKLITHNLAKYLNSIL